MMSVPVMSDGIRSGVNWMREKLKSRTSATVRTSRVLASPGTPTSREFPPTKRERSTCSTTSSWPMIRLRISERMASAIGRSTRSR